MADCEIRRSRTPTLTVPRMPRVTTYRPTDLDAPDHRASEVVGVVCSPEALGGVIHDLLVIGLEPGQISALTVCASPVLNPRLGARAGTAKPGAFFCVARIGGCEAIVAEGGRLACAIAAALLVGLVDAERADLIANTVDSRHHEAITALVDAGGVILWVKCRCDARRHATFEALRHHGAHCVHQVAGRV